MIIETKLNEEGVYEPIINFNIGRQHIEIEAETIDYEIC